MTANPVFVNELRQSAFRRNPVLIAAGWIGCTFLLLVLALARFGKMPLLILPSIALPLLVPSIAAGAFAKEYEQQTWQDLFLTRLTNAQVVIGKFCAYLLQVGALLLAFVPALLMLIVNDYSFDDTSLLTWINIAAMTIVFMSKLLLSACLYILLAMVCSRYSGTRRTALAWSYAALALYAALGWFVWTLVGQLAYQNDVVSSVMNYGPSGPRHQPIDLSLPGFMEGFHLIFCSVVGIGSVVLLWVSLSEQRGYRVNSANGEKMRNWQPVVRRQAELRG